MRKYFDVRVGYGSVTKSRKRQPATWDIVPYDKSQPETWVEFVFSVSSTEFLEGQGLKTRSEIVLPATGVRKLKTSPAANAESESPQSAKTFVSKTAGTSSQKRSAKRDRELSSEADSPSKAPKLTPQSSASSQFPTTAIDRDFFRGSDPEYDRSFEAPDEYAWQYSSPDVDESR
ncbi:hypothetical protein EWM64_g7390 [Hericium alpestre]|uniref:Uncharacterized protein n=1 Tax=Hericium alpestre TaxID=135208 RepID=A0A4Y9ZQU5_9AGAM|nr:hypothetical protein EWM64_g7390 [Hericium alpestre]